MTKSHACPKGVLLGITSRTWSVPPVPSYGVLLHAAIETAKISLPTVIDAVAGRTSYARCTERLDSWSRKLVDHAKIELQTTGIEHLQQGRSYVVMSNHQSDYDIPVLFQALQIPLRMVAKTELFRIPLFGQAMLDSGFIELDRQNRRRAMESLKLAQRRITQDGLSVWIAPEGTRSKSGVMGPFKSGGFYLAIDTEASILPVSIDGTHSVLRSGDRQVHKERSVSVRIHPAVATTDYSRRSLSELRAIVRSAIASGLPDANLAACDRLPDAS